MVVAIIADLHSNLEALQAVLKEIDRRNVQKIVCLGDLTGYNTNPNEVVDIIRERGIPTIMGNHDAAVCGLEEPWLFRAAAKRAIEWQIGQVRDDNKEWLAQASEQIEFNGLFLMVHGSPGDRDDYIIDWLDAMRQMEYLNAANLDICFFGHSHHPSFFCEKGDTPRPMANSVVELNKLNKYLINPGAVGQPRDSDPRAAFGLLDIEKLTFEFCRVEYDINSCVKKILDAGLPFELAKRLPNGK